MHRNMRRPPVRISRTTHTFRIRFIDTDTPGSGIERVDRLFRNEQDAHTWAEFEAVKRGMELFDVYRLEVANGAECLA